MRKSLTIQTLLKDKERLEKDISSLINKFEEKHGINVEKAIYLRGLNFESKSAEISIKL